jgi:hypothetical protein
LREVNIPPKLLFGDTYDLFDVGNAISHMTSALRRYVNPVFSDLVTVLTFLLFGTAKLKNFVLVTVYLQYQLGGIPLAGKPIPGKALGGGGKQYVLQHLKNGTFACSVTATRILVVARKENASLLFQGNQNSFAECNGLLKP